MSNDPVNPAEVPVFTGDLATLDVKVKSISTGGVTISTAAGDVHTSFGGLTAYYQAPEAEQLFATTKPVSDLGLELSTDICTIAGALGTYSRDAAPLVKKLEDLKSQAETFRTNADSDHKWREDGGKVDENNKRRNEIADVWTQFQEVERTAYAKIVALVGGKPLKVNDGSNGEGMYGYDAKALKDSKSLPWGDAVDKSVPWWKLWDHAYDFGKGVIVDGVWGTIKGLGTLVGVNGWGAAGQAWTGLAKLATGLAIVSIPGVGPLFFAVPDDKLPSWLRDSRTAMKETGKALLAWDQWGHNPSRAAGAVTFNVLTTVFTGGEAGSVEGAGKAGAVAKTLSAAGKVGKAIDPMTYVFKGAGFGISKVSDVMAGLKGITDIKIPKINVDGAFALPEGAIKLPDGGIKLPPGTAIPEGAIKTADGGITLPKGTVELPPGTVKLEVGGKTEFLDPHGNVYDHDGNILQHGDQAPHDGANLPAGDHPPVKLDTPAKVRTPELVGVGARDGDRAVNLGSDLSHPGHIPDHTPGGHTPDHTPGGHTPDYTPGGHAPEGPRNDLNAPRTGHGTPTTGGHDTPTAAGHDGAPAGGHDAGSTGGHDGDSTAGHGSHPGTGGHNGTPIGGHDGRPGTNGHEPASREPVKRPEFMKDGPNPYGERGSLSKEQIEEIQIYRINEEPGYLEKFYDSIGRRRHGKPVDESLFAPPKITKLGGDDTPWIRAADAPEPPPPHYLDDHYKPLGAEGLTDEGRLDLLDGFAEKRHNAVAWDNLVKDWKDSSGHPQAEGVYKASHTEMGDATEAFGEAAARHHFIAERYLDFEEQALLGPKNGNDQFDQVWLHGDGRAVVVEAKSSADTELGKRNLPGPLNMPGVKGAPVSQGSREYFFDILRAMNKRGETELVEKLEAALAEGKLDYVVVKGGKNAGSYNGLLYRMFDISKGTLP